MFFVESSDDTLGDSNAHTTMKYVDSYQEENKAGLFCKFNMLEFIKWIDLGDESDL